MINLGAKARETAEKVYYASNIPMAQKLVLEALELVVAEKDEQIASLLELIKPVSDAQQKAWDEMRLKNLPVTSINLDLSDIMAIAFKYRELASQKPQRDKE